MTDTNLSRNLPQFTLEQVKAIVSDLYHINGEYKELNCERDISYRIRTGDSAAYVVKISNAAEPEGVIDFQVKALAHIREQDSEILVPDIVSTKDNKAYDWIQSNRGDRHMIRMLTFLEGDVIKDVPGAHNSVTRYNTGQMVGRLAKSLSNFFHPYADSNIHLWDIHRCLELRPQIKHVSDPEIRELCTRILDRAESYVLPQLKKTRCQVVHQDAHELNVIVDPEDPTKIRGVIDFGDMVFGSVVTDIAAACDCFPEDCLDPLDVVCDVTAGFDNVFPLEEDEIDLVYETALIQLVILTVIVEARDAVMDGSEPVHIPATGIYPHTLKLLWNVGREEGIRRLREACRFPVYSVQKEGDEIFEDNYDELFKRREEKLGEIWHFYNTALHFTRGQGSWLYTPDGTAYLDAYNNVPQMGHSHPYIVRAIARQAEALNTNTRYLCDITVEYAERLTADLPEHLDACIFVNSGSEANDLAMQIAKALSGHDGGIVMDESYHGCTELTTALSHESWQHLPADLHPQEVETLMVPDTYRGPYAGDQDAALKYANDADRAINALASRGHKPAAFMIDTSLCSNGVMMAPDNYFNQVAEKVKGAGGFVIVDEVQAGLARMGTFWGFRANGLADKNVDFITLGKPVGNAHPLGVIILSSKLLDQFLKGTHTLLFSTFGGNTVSCAAGIAVLDVIERENLIEKSNIIGDYLRARLVELSDKHSLIGDVRGKGMMTGLEFVTDRKTRTPAVEETKRLLERMKSKHVLVGTGSPNALKLRPPLAWNKAEVDFFIAALDQCLSEEGHNGGKDPYPLGRMFV